MNVDAVLCLLASLQLAIDQFKITADAFNQRVRTALDKSELVYPYEMK